MTSSRPPMITQSSHPKAPQPHPTVALIWSTWVVLATVALTALALAAHRTPYFSLDLEIARAVQSYQAEWFSRLMYAVSWPGFIPQIIILVGLILVVLYFAYSRWSAVSFGFAGLGIAAAQLVIKILVNRPRPSPDLIHVVDPSLIGGGIGLTFPAGHPGSAVALFGFLGYLIYTSRKPSHWRTLILISLAVFIALVGVSRIYEGEHWFSDVIGGYLLGSLWLSLTIYLYEWGKARFFLKRLPESHRPV